MNKRFIISTKNLALASALFTMGIPFDNPAFHKSKGYHGGDQYQFYFEERSLCGKYSARELIKAWDDPKWNDKNPDHPFSYIKEAFNTREKLLDKVNQSVSQVIIQKNGRMAILPSNASEALQEQIFARL